MGTIVYIYIRSNVYQCSFKGQRQLHSHTSCNKSVFSYLGCLNIYNTTHRKTGLKGRILFLKIMRGDSATNKAGL